MARLTDVRIGVSGRRRICRRWLAACAGQLAGRRRTWRRRSLAGGRLSSSQASRCSARPADLLLALGLACCEGQPQGLFRRADHAARAHQCLRVPAAAARHPHEGSSACLRHARGDSVARGFGSVEKAADLPRARRVEIPCRCNDVSRPADSQAPIGVPACRAAADVRMRSRGLGSAMRRQGILGCRARLSSKPQPQKRCGILPFGVARVNHLRTPARQDDP
mmetsp:Transcript_21507/g.61471  ORF Transcript_21507/g.61471 Transcript_21507/m.61471 type:complete len:222 (+) Transcript_21507:275-940(+)